MGVSTDQKKSLLVDALFEKQRLVDLLPNIIESSKKERFTKNKDTFPRICNLLMRNPDAIKRSALLAMRVDLQFHQLGSIAHLFTCAADDFNNHEIDSGEWIDRNA